MNTKNKIGDMPASSLLLPRLTKIQKEEGYLSEERLKELAKEISIPITRIYEVATFYSFITIDKKGKYVIRVCASPSCHINGSDDILEIFERLLEIKVGGTTKDNKFTLEKTSCIGCCDEAPAALINDEAYTKLNDEKIREILAKCK
ncbi:MAG: NADH-quinone oxidoreductase subunit NuoE [Nanoarchaeota archaeon]|nr:NADH-quinone oxidoreductase subunit NuoE [Nanoarchaeota archaeon]